MRNELDITVRDPRGQLLAVIEAKNAKSLDRSLALQVFDRLRSVEAVQPARYVLVASQKVGFLWSRGPSGWSQPQEVPTDWVTREYAPWLKADDWLRGAEWEEVLFNWVWDATREGPSSKWSIAGSPVTSSFLGALKGATPNKGVAA